MKLYKHSVTVDVVMFTIVDNDLKILIIQRADHPFKGSPALPGGFLHDEETTLSAAERILRNKAGIEDVYLEQLYTFDSLDRDPRGEVLSVAYFALVPPGEINIRETKDTQKPELVSAASMPPLAFDHSHIVKYAIERLRAKLEYTNTAYSLLPRLFTLSDLQKTYEIILGRRIDKRNFRKKWKELGLLKETDSFSKGGRQRPAKLYQFKSRKPAQLKKFF
jgi:8-oxo-dGTP diphosphatase